MKQYKHMKFLLFPFLFLSLAGSYTFWHYHSVTKPTQVTRKDNTRQNQETTTQEPDPVSTPSTSQSSKSVTQQQNNTNHPDTSITSAKNLKKKTHSTIRVDGGTHVNTQLPMSPSLLQSHNNFIYYFALNLVTFLFVSLIGYKYISKKLLDIKTNQKQNEKDDVLNGLKKNVETIQETLQNIQKIQNEETDKNVKDLAGLNKIVTNIQKTLQEVKPNQKPNDDVLNELNKNVKDLAGLNKIVTNIQKTLEDIKTNQKQNEKDDVLNGLKKNVETIQETLQNIQKIQNEETKKNVQDLAGLNKIVTNIQKTLQEVKPNQKPNDDVLNELKRNVETIQKTLEDIKPNQKPNDDVLNELNKNVKDLTELNKNVNTIEETLQNIQKIQNEETDKNVKDLAGLNKIVTNIQKTLGDIKTQNADSYDSESSCSSEDNDNYLLEQTEQSKKPTKISPIANASSALVHEIAKIYTKNGNDHYKEHNYINAIVSYRNALTGYENLPKDYLYSPKELQDIYQKIKNIHKGIWHKFTEENVDNTNNNTSVTSKENTEFSYTNIEDVADKKEIMSYALALYESIMSIIIELKNQLDAQTHEQDNALFYSPYSRKNSMWSVNSSYSRKAFVIDPHNNNIALPSSVTSLTNDDEDDNESIISSLPKKTKNLAKKRRNSLPLTNSQITTLNSFSKRPIKTFNESKLPKKVSFETNESDNINSKQNKHNRHKKNNSTILNHM